MKDAPVACDRGTLTRSGDDFIDYCTECAPISALVCAPLILTFWPCKLLLSQVVILIL
jgi:hypothetical protein